MGDAMRLCNAGRADGRNDRKTTPGTNREPTENHQESHVGEGASQRRTAAVLDPDRQCPRALLVKGAITS